MSFKGICVCLDNRPDAASRLSFALKLAKKHEAHLTAMYMIYVPISYYNPDGQWGPIMSQWESEAKKAFELAKHDAEAQAKEEGVSFAWQSFRSTELHKALASARAHDLVIMGQKASIYSDTDFGSDFYEGFVLKLGRPVLYLPFQRTLPHKIERIVIAWDGSREATRAISDALPFLKLAKQIRTITIVEASKDDSHKVDIKTYLSRHGLQMEQDQILESDKTPAEVLLKRSSELNADLIVMGAYGHHRLTELVLGGTTREILKEMNLPVLMSH